MGHVPLAEPTSSHHRTVAFVDGDALWFDVLPLGLLATLAGTMRQFEGPRLGGEAWCL